LISFLDFSNLDSNLIDQYKKIMDEGFPRIILQSEVTKKYWNKLEDYFPKMQLFIVHNKSYLIGLMNMIPIFWDQPLDELPENGWDWIVKKGVEDYEKGIHPNTLGGLQIIVAPKYQGKGYSKLLISKGKDIGENLGYRNLIIPIRPILKHQYPDMLLQDYINLKKDNEMFDPWIRTHMASGAEVIKVCENSMNITGDIFFWEVLLGRKITNSGKYYIKGALNAMYANVEENFGEYREENLWVNYTLKNRLK